jgi:hypothetical protein
MMMNEKYITAFHWDGIYQSQAELSTLQMKMGIQKGCLQPQWANTPLGAASSPCLQKRRTNFKGSEYHAALDQRQQRPDHLRIEIRARTTLQFCDRLCLGQRLAVHPSLDHDTVCVGY